MTDEATGPQLSNEMTDEQRAKLTFQHKEKYQRLLQAFKDANNTLKQFGKEIKSDLGAKGLADIKDMIDLATPEGEARLREDMERRARVMRWMAMPIGTTEDMFPKDDRRPLTERAYAAGKKSGLSGEPHSNPYHQTNDGNAAWAKGWQDGQAVMVTAGIKSIDTSVAADSLAG